MKLDALRQSMDANPKRKLFAETIRVLQKARYNRLVEVIGEGTAPAVWMKTPSILARVFKAPLSERCNRVNSDTFAMTVRRMLLLQPLKNKQIKGSEVGGLQRCEASNCKASNNKTLDPYGNHAAACYAANQATNKRAQLIEKALIITAKRAGVQVEAQPSSEELTNGRLTAQTIQALFPKKIEVKEAKRRAELAIRLFEQEQNGIADGEAAVDWEIKQIANQQRHDGSGGQTLTFDILLRDTEETRAYVVDHAVVHSTAPSYLKAEAIYRKGKEDCLKKKTESAITTEENRAEQQ